MDIQRGDQVYYRGEVWTVWTTYSSEQLKHTVTLQRINGSDRVEREWANRADLQRVEQVR